MSDPTSPLRLQRLSYEDLRAKAERFLDEYHPSRSIPVPIAEIVEFDLDMTVIPIEGLRADVDVDAFLSSDLDRIYVDERAMRVSLPRFHFSLAHEVGHWWLHDEFYEQTQIASVADWRAAQERIGANYRWFEFQANSFAGLVLVPTKALRDAVKHAQEEMTSRGLDPDLIQEHPLRHRFVQGLADHFEVSAETMERRLVKDGHLAELMPPERD